MAAQQFAQLLHDLRRAVVETGQLLRSGVGALVVAAELRVESAVFFDENGSAVHKFDRLGRCFNFDHSVYCLKLVER